GAEFRAMSDDEALAQLDDIGVIARVTPEDKVHLVDLLRMKGHIVAMTGDGVNDAPALKKADIGVAMGITGTEVSKEAAVMILTDDDFSTIVKAVELGRGLYDNLKKYIRFQVGLLIGYIFTFLGSSILNVLGGVPFVPLQTLFMNFTIQVFQAVGLGYGEPSAGLMERKPRPSDEALLGRRLLVWLVVAGGVMGLSTLAVLYWANQTFDESIARTMGMITFSISNVAFSFATKDERHSAFSLKVMGDRPFLYATAASILTILLIPNLEFFRRILDTSELTVEQWAICIVVGLLILVVSEVRKLVIKTPLDEEPATVVAPAAAPAVA
ncbi:MAG TPA: HAD-IC family P-type ATPase, partial [Candidatus Limnocylindrales bacterium]